LEDVQQIVKLDKECYGEITDLQTQDAFAMFEARVRNSPRWFFVAVHQSEIVGILSSQPMVFSAESFRSWDECTANGTLEGTFDESSTSVYVVALTVNEKGSTLGATDALIVKAFAQGIREGKKEAFFASRMPGYHQYKDVMTPEEYANKRIEKEGKEVALDWQIRFYESLGLRQVRVVRGGFAADIESCGNSVLFSLRVPFAGWPLPRVWASLFSTIASRPRIAGVLSKFA
jgi:hypothetical protein